MRILITGASRGIGHGLAASLLARGDRVIAAMRNVDDGRELASMGAVVIEMDVTSDESVKRARRSSPLGAFEALDVVVNNAGMSGDAQRAPGMDLARVAETISVNAIGATRVYDAFIDLLRNGERPRLVNVSSEAGSLSAFRPGKKPEYAMSKAALNALTRWIASVEDGVTCVSIDPGWTCTRTGGEGAHQSIEVAAMRMTAAIDRLTPAHSGGFFDTDLMPMAW